MSRFVSAGTSEDPPSRPDEWHQAQRDLEEARARKAAETAQSDGKSLYEVLQANKASKEDAFQEALRLKNQFRSLDDDEVDFLDSVLESTRKKDEGIRKETSERLEEFRRQREEVERRDREEVEGGVRDPEGGVGELEGWGGRKRRRREKEGGVRGKMGVLGMGKVRRVDDGETRKVEAGMQGERSVEEVRKLNDAEGLPRNQVLSSGDGTVYASASADKKVAMEESKAVKTSQSAMPALGLGAYSSDVE